MIFVSGDKLHRTTAPHFLDTDQAFIWAPDLKADLAKLDAHYSNFPEHVKAQGLVSFAFNPPEEGEFLTTQLWDRFLPAWRQRKKGFTSPPESNASLLAMLDEMGAAPETSEQVTTNNANYVIIERKVPVSRKWRILPPGVGNEPEARR
jgi:hypothetical protein